MTYALPVADRGRRGAPGVGGSLVDGGGGRDARPVPPERLAGEGLARGLRTVYREPRQGWGVVYGTVSWLDGTREWVVKR